MIGFTSLTALAVACLLWAERRSSRIGIWLAKPLASLGFLGVALAAGALGSVYGRWLLSALVLSALGDVLLISRGARLRFGLGLLSFLLSHVIFTGAFAILGLDPLASLLAAALALPAAWAGLRWLWPHLAPAMRTPVLAYVIVISLMGVTAAGACSHVGEPGILIGAGLFYVSDLAVARERFVSASFWNRAWGLPLYYGAQLVLAWTIA